MTDRCECNRPKLAASDHCTRCNGNERRSPGYIERNRLRRAGLCLICTERPASPRHQASGQSYYNRCKRCYEKMRSAHNRAYRVRKKAKQEQLMETGQ